jgi:hypothetical protein
MATAKAMSSADLWKSGLSQALNLMAQISVTKLIEVANIQEKNKYHVVLQKEKKRLPASPVLCPNLGNAGPIREPVVAIESIACVDLITRTRGTRHIS